MNAEPRLLLLQVRRATDPMAAHEVGCFVQATGIPADNLVVHDLTRGSFATAELARFNGLLVGGSGEFSVSSGNLQGSEALLDLLREVVERRLPMFASCFGYHSLVQALGGEVVADPARMEVGTYELQCSDAARSDELFGSLPDRFMAQMGHIDRVATPPAGSLNLAASEGCAHQALRVPDAPVWAVQFHPELTRVTNLERFEHYLASEAGYGDQAEADAIRARFVESPEASSLLRAFVDLVRSA